MDFKYLRDDHTTNYNFSLGAAKLPGLQTCILVYRQILLPFPNKYLGYQKVHESFFAECINMEVI